MKKIKEHKIMIIDNDKISADLLKDILNKHNCRIDNVDNEIDAIDKIAMIDYDYYFISDYINSFNLINFIKALKKHCKIIVMSSDNSFKTEEQIRSFGITFLLKKPFSKKEVKELIIN